MKITDFEPIAVAVLLFFGGAYRVSQEGGDKDGYALLVLGSVVLGAWLVLLVIRTKDKGDG